MELTRFDVEFCVEEVDWDVNGLQKVEQLIWRRFKGPSEIIVVVVLRCMKVPILESWGFSQFNCPDWPCSGVCTHQWWREEQLQSFFQLAWAQVELARHFYFTATLGQTYFFYKHKLLTFNFVWERDAHREPVVATCEDWKTKICTLKILGIEDRIKLGLLGPAI